MTLSGMLEEGDVGRGGDRRARSATLVAEGAAMMTLIA